MRLFLSALALLASLALPRVAAAFCGFYVSGADAKLFNRATQVVLMRAGTRTVLSMQNAYEGPLADFAMVVPVPVVLQKEQVKTLPRELLARVDQLGAPRLVEYWEQDPCTANPLGTIGVGSGQGFGTGMGRLSGSHRTKPEVTIEAEFAVGEYDIVILSATDSTALDTWLRENRYKIPAGAEPYLRPYVQAGMKFFVAKVDIAKVAMADGRPSLSPLRFHYDSETFSLPIRLGLINAGEAQDLIVSILSEKQRYEVANYPNVMIPTNLDVSEQTRGSFGTFYAALLDETLKQKPGAVVTEYAWDAGKCDPCPGPTLSGRDLATLGGDVLSGSNKLPAGVSSGSSALMSWEAPTVTGRLPREVVERIVRQRMGALRACYEKATLSTPGLQGRVAVTLVIGPNGLVSAVKDSGSDLKDPTMLSCSLGVYKGLTFPAPESGIVSVGHGVRFGPNASGPRSTGIVLTRLHMRYTKEALGEDLVFKEAPAIRGGREVRPEAGRLEQGAVITESNNFQARYAIRHPWTGALACDKPVRGIWGGPPDGAAPGPKAARDVAFVERTGGLGTFLASALPPISGATTKDGEPPPAPAPPAASSSPPPAASSAAPASSSSPPAAGGGCGCHTAPGGSGAAWLSGILVLGLLARRRRG